MDCIFNTDFADFTDYAHFAIALEVLKPLNSTHKQICEISVSALDSIQLERLFHFQAFNGIHFQDLIYLGGNGDEKDHDENHTGKGYSGKCDRDVIDG